MFITAFARAASKVQWPGSMGDVMHCKEHMAQLLCDRRCRCQAPVADSISLLHAKHSSLRCFQTLVDMALESTVAELSNAAFQRA